MLQNESNPLSRADRQRRRRACRRLISSITPAEWNQQLQSALFQLPAEIRYQIFTYVLCQRPNPSAPVNPRFFVHGNRPGHICYPTTADVAVLQTCRLAYAEAHLIPQRSATYHWPQSLEGMWSEALVRWERHVTSQTGAKLYHLHQCLLRLDDGEMVLCFLPHLRWRRVSWTFTTYLARRELKENDFYDAVVDQLELLERTLKGVVVPGSCEEVMLELETRAKFRIWGQIWDTANGCVGLEMRRKDGEVLKFDAGLACEYLWISNKTTEPENRAGSQAKRRKYRALRMCWRSKEPRRGYMSYDHVDCMALEGWKEVESIIPFTGKFGPRANT